MIYLKADTAVEVLIGPAVAVGDGFTPVTNLVLTSADEAELIKYNQATTLTGAAITNALAALTSAVDGYYSLELTTGETNTEGPLWIVIQDDSLILPLRHEYMVVSANVYDSLFAVAATDQLQVDVVEQVGTTVPAPATNGIPDVNVREWLDTGVAAATAGTPDVNATRWNNGAIPAQGVTGVPEVNITHQVDTVVPAPATAGIPDVNVREWLDNAVAAANAGVPNVNVTEQVGTTVPTPAVTGVPDVNLTHHVDVAASVTNSELDVNVGQVIGTAPTLTGTNIDVNIATTDDIDLSATQKASVNTEVDSALDTTIVELTQGVPATTPTVRTALMLLYMALRNKLDVATVATDTLEIHNDAGTRITQKLLTDDGTDYSEAKMISGA